MSSVTLIDMNCGNIASVEFALDRLGVHHVRTQSVEGIASAERLILPGVGTAGFAMSQLHRLDLVTALKTARQPIMGICLGMQLLFEDSEEGHTPCLGLLEGKVARLSGSAQLPVPHMGWSTLDICQPDNRLVATVQARSFAYFVHSYACPVSEATVASVDYGRACAAIVQSRNVYGCQFHPERSSSVGAQILENFMSVPC
ncbi:imidazole glycerol phosphate synthase subunit HisH [Parvularcula sp. IMCC14364]|uniref:imidazole glycerol phosphate synthase subunit HisH n=1 Tax=Parvularcula sp. IMCC14364 TaxID=3067902 RepID=UPI0027426282|nr:imidazole glycerol phosphate synthase subunit HisH [Parvularcula sp. IMCC14364]